MKVRRAAWFVPGLSLSKAGRRDVFLLFALLVVAAAPAAARVQNHADILVRQLRELPALLPASAPSNGVTPAIEIRRRELYDQLRQLGDEGVLALSRGLKDQDVQLRKNVAVALNALAGGWWERAWPKVDIRKSLPALIVALRDRDGMVRGSSAQAIGSIGPDAARAVPALVRLLTNDDEGSRNSACIGLRGIGPAAKDALPALKKALTDSSPYVRRFAKLAIENIER